ncbi:MAG: hypothetical protein H6559_25325 [Lewinellaceae bacterium]|nr:hypothetical protein [Lewinellaceae bacterium]
MIDPPHIIQRQLWEVDCASEGEYQAICQYIKEQLQGELGQMLEQALDEYFPPGQHIRVDQLVVDVGDISIDELEEALAGRFRSRFIETLNELIHEKKGLLQQSGLSENTWQAFEYFLLNGYAPWWIPLEEKTTLTVSYQSLTRLFPNLVARFFRKEGHKERVRKRLIYQLGDASVRTTIRLLEPGGAPFIEGYADDLLAFHRHRPVVPLSENAMATLIWEVILAYLMADRGSAFNTFSFVRSSLQLLAARYNISFSALLKAMHQQLPALVPATRLKTNLAFIVEYLFKEWALDAPAFSTSKSVWQDAESWLGHLMASSPTGKTWEYLAAIGQRPSYEPLLKQRLQQQNFRKQFIYLLGALPWGRAMEALTGTRARALKPMYEDLALVLRPMAGLLGGEEALGYYLKDAWLHNYAFGNFELSSPSLQLGRFLGAFQAAIPVSAGMFFDNLSQQIQLHQEQLSLGAGWKKAVGQFTRQYAPAAAPDPFAEIEHLLSFEPNVPATLDRLPILLSKLPGEFRAPLINLLWSLSDGGKNRQLRSLLNDEIFGAFLQAIAPTQQEFIQKSVKAFVHIHGRQPLIPVSSQEAQLSLKEAILDTLLADRGSFFNRKSFTRDSLHRFARQYNVPYEALLGYLLQRQEVLAGYVPELNRIVLDLQEEAAPGSPFPSPASELSPEQSLAYNWIRFQQYLSWGNYAEKAYNFQAEAILKQLLLFQAKKLKQLLLQYRDKQQLLQRLAPFDAEARTDIAKLLAPGHRQFIEEIWEEWQLLQSYIPSERETDLMSLIAQAMLEYIFVIKKKYFVKSTFGRSLVHFLSQASGRARAYTERLVGQAAQSLSLPFYGTFLPPSASPSERAPSFARFKSFLKKGDLYHLGINKPRELNPYVLALIASSERKMVNVFKQLPDAYFSARILALYLDDNAKLRLLEVLAPLYAEDSGEWASLFQDMSAPAEADIQLDGLKEAIWVSILMSMTAPEKGPSAIQTFIAENLEKRITTEGIAPEIIIQGLDKAAGKMSSGKRTEWMAAIKKEIQERLEQPADRLSSEPPFPDDKFKEPMSEPQGISIENAGLVLLWPYWKLLFERLELVADDDFVSLESRQRAVHILQYLATGETQTPEPLLAFNKWICNLPLAAPVPYEIDLDAESRELMDGLLLSVNQRWKPLQNSGIEALRQTFLQRRGILRLDTEKPRLTVQRKEGIDALLGALPWSFGIVNLPWKPHPLYVEW